MKIDVRTLCYLGACRRGLRWFKRAFPNGLNVTGPPDEAVIERLAKAVCDGRTKTWDYVLWLSDALLRDRGPVRYRPELVYDHVLVDPLTGERRPRAERKAWRARLRVTWVLLAEEASYED